MQNLTKDSTSPINPRINNKILWISLHGAMETSTNLSLNPDFEIEVVTDFSSALGQLRVSDFAVAVVEQNLADKSTVGFFLEIKNAFPSVVRILMTNSGDTNLVESFVNKASVFRYFLKPLSMEILSKELFGAISHHIFLSDQKKLLREVAHKNRQLEELTGGLEKLVEERTSSFRSSTKEAEQKQKQIRQLIHFVKELSLLTNLEELFVLIRKELRSLKKFGEPFLACYTQKNPVLFFFNNNQTNSKVPNGPWPKIQSAVMASREIRQYFADEFSRPFAKIVAIPLRQRVGDPDTAGTLFVEHSFADDEFHNFLEYLMERIQPIGIALDRLLIASQLKAVSAQWERTFDAIQNPVNIVSIDYQILRANRHFYAGGSHESCHKVFVSRELVCEGCPVAEALKTGEPQYGEIKKDNKTYRVHSYPISLSGDKYSTTAVNHYVDITEDRNLYSRMIQNEKMAALGTMAGHIAHELNNPLTGLKSLTQVMQSEVKLDNPLYKDLMEIENAVTRCQVIIKNLLEFSTGPDAGEVADISVNELVEKTLPMLKTAMRTHRNIVTLTVEDELVRVNPHLIQQVIFNLVNNACQAMDQPGQVEIKTDKRNNMMAIIITDSGPGIPGEHLTRIFEPFFTTKTEGSGTGLGLSMSRAIVEKFGGELRMEKSDDTGSVFTALIPIIEKV